MVEELVILVDKNDNPIGTEEKVNVIYRMENYIEHLQHYYLILMED